MMRKGKSVAFIRLVLILFVSLAWVGYGALHPGVSIAYDAPPKDQGHTGPDPNNPDPQNPPGGPNPPEGGDPVSITDGNFSYNHRDIYIPGGMPLSITRYYNSNDGWEGPFGHGWSFMPFASAVEVMKGAETHVIIRLGNGFRLQYKSNEDGSFSPPTGWSYQLSKNPSGYALNMGGGTVYSFDLTGKLLSITNKSSSQLSFSYDNAGKVTKISDINDRTLSFAYGANNKVRSIVDFAGRTVSYGYNDSDDLTSITNPEGGTLTCSYNSNHRLTALVDEREKTYLSQGYDDRKRVATQTYAEGTATFSYYPSWGSTQMGWQPGGQTHHYYYNSDGKVTQIYDSSTYVTRYMYYDLQLNLIQYADPDGKSTYYTYDGNGRLTSIKDIFNQTTTIQYHTAFDLIKQIDFPSGSSITFAYDSGGNLISTTLPDASQVTFAYSSSGVTVTEPDGASTISYDANGYVTSITAKDGVTTSYGYDSVGNAISMTNPSGTSTYEYDKCNRLLKAVDPSSNETLYGYDAHGNLTSIALADGTSYNFTYDDYNQLSSLDPSTMEGLALYFNPTSDVNQRVSKIMASYLPLTYLSGIMP